MQTDNAVTSTKPAPTLNRRYLLRAAATAVGATAAATKLPAATTTAGAKRWGMPAIRQQASLVFAINDSETAKIQPLVDEYASQQKISIALQPSPYASLLEKLTINLTQATGAYDLVSIDDPWVPLFAGGEYLTNLQTLFDDRGVSLDPEFIPEFVALGDFPAGSGLRALPWIGNVQVFAWRNDILQGLGLAAPTTWDDVVAIAETVTKERSATGVYGFGLRGQTGNPAATSFLPVLRGYGTDLFNEAWEPQLDTALALQALTTHLALAQLAPPGVGNVGHLENGMHLADGSIAQSADIWPDQLLVQPNLATPQVASQIEISAQPAQPSLAPMTMSGNWLLGIPEGSQQTEAALEFMLWLTAPEQQRRLLIDHSLPATRVSVYQDADAIATFPFLPSLLEAGRKAVPRPRTPHYNAVEVIFGGYLSRAMTGQMNGEDALLTANAEIRAYLTREGVLK
ncbi:MAG: extracellular solute-binding protein [Chloroflexia bacterium]|nr:extracellular solute-binding protein [Chloroflexia bacterium]